MSAPHLTVVICTYNRADNLPRCVGALLAQDGATELPWEILVVDNNSSDHTRPTVERLATDAPVSIRYAFEPEQGLNNARNRGIDEARGTYVSYIDDDIRVSPAWLTAVFEATRRHDADAVGGRIHLEPDVVLPRWIRDDMRGFLGHQDFGEEPFRMDGQRCYPFGGNMTIHRRAFDLVGRWDPDMGRKGAGLRPDELKKGEELAFFSKLAEVCTQGIWYEPRALVYHAVPETFLRKRHFRMLHFSAGRERAREDPRHFGATVFGVPRFLLLQAFKAASRYAWQTVRCGPDAAFRQQMTLLHFVGQIVGYRQRATARQARPAAAQADRAP